MENYELTRRFGAVLRLLRLQANLSQEELADKCNLHRTYIGTIERGEKRVTITTAYKLSCALNVKLSEMLKMVEELEEETA
jgi:transcriptional regulator with XRE-family HTH domain